MGACVQNWQKRRQVKKEKTSGALGPSPTTCGGFSGCRRPNPAARAEVRASPHAPPQLRPPRGPASPGSPAPGAGAPARGWGEGAHPPVQPPPHRLGGPRPFPPPGGLRRALRRRARSGAGPARSRGGSRERLLRDLLAPPPRLCLRGSGCSVSLGPALAAAAAHRPPPRAPRRPCAPVRSAPALAARVPAKAAAAAPRSCRRRPLPARPLWAPARGAAAGPRSPDAGPEEAGAAGAHHQPRHRRGPIPHQRGRLRVSGPGRARMGIPG